MLQYFEEICLNCGGFRENARKTLVKKGLMKVVLPSKGGGEVE